MTVLSRRCVVSADASCHLASAHILWLHQIDDLVNSCNQKTLGRLVTCVGLLVQERLQRAQIRPLDAWIADQPDPKPTRPEAIRYALTYWLTGQGYVRHREDRRGELMAKADKEQTSSSEEQPSCSVIQSFSDPPAHSQSHFGWISSRTLAATILSLVLCEVQAQPSSEAKKWMADLMRYERVVGQALRDNDVGTLVDERRAMSQFLSRASVLGSDYFVCVSAANSLWNIVLDQTADRPISPTASRQSLELFRSLMPRCEKLFKVSQERQL